MGRFLCLHSAISDKDNRNLYLRENTLIIWTEKQYAPMYEFTIIIFNLFFNFVKFGIFIAIMTIFELHHIIGCPITTNMSHLTLERQSHQLTITSLQKLLSWWTNWIIFSFRNFGNCIVTQWASNFYIRIVSNLFQLRFHNASQLCWQHLE